jgi:hypothetical protein
LPDDITLPLLWAGLLFNLFLGPVAIADAVLGAAAGYLLLWSIYWLFKLVTGKEGMGFGDFKLLAALGAWLGWQALPIIILLSSAVGAVLGVLILALRGQGRSQPLPFGPYLAAAGWISLLWGGEISALFFPRAMSRPLRVGITGGYRQRQERGHRASRRVGIQRSSMRMWSRGKLSSPARRRWPRSAEHFGSEVITADGRLDRARCAGSCLTIRASANGWRP